MIVRFPTGFYKDIINQESNTPTNVTYTISMTDPPRTNLVFPKIPSSIASRQSMVGVKPQRSQFGSLVFSVSNVSRSNLGNNSNQYTIGNVLDFVASEPNPIEPMLVNNVTEVRHDTSVIDLVAVGLSPDDLKIINSAAIETHEILSKELNDAKQNRLNAEQEITTQQKIINEIDKTILALQNISTGNGISEIISKLHINKSAAVKLRDEQIVLANDYANTAEIILNKLLAVSAVVK